MRREKKENQASSLKKMVQDIIPDINIDFASECLTVLPFLSDPEKQQFNRGLNNIKKEGEAISNGCEWTSARYGKINTPDALQEIAIKSEKDFITAKEKCTASDFSGKETQQQINEVLYYMNAQYRGNIAEKYKPVVQKRYEKNIAREKKDYTSKFIRASKHLESDFIKKAMDKICPMSAAAKERTDSSLQYMHAYSDEIYKDYDAGNISADMLRSDLKQEQEKYAKAKEAFDAGNFSMLEGDQKVDIVLDYMKASQKVNILQGLVKEEEKKEAQKEEQTKYYSEAFTGFFTEEGNKKIVQKLVVDMIPLANNMHRDAENVLSLMKEEKKKIENNFDEGKYLPYKLKFQLERNQKTLEAREAEYQASISCGDPKSDQDRCALNYIKALHSVSHLKYVSTDYAASEDRYVKHRTNRLSHATTEQIKEQINEAPLRERLSVMLIDQDSGLNGEDVRLIGNLFMLSDTEGHTVEQSRALAKAEYRIFSPEEREGLIAPSTQRRSVEDERA